MIGADALRASNDHEEQRLSPQGGQVHRKCAELLCSSRRARVSPSTACDYATAPPFIRAASRCVSFVEGYRSMWLQPIEQYTQRATTPVKACGKKVCRLSPPLHPPLLGSLEDHGTHSHEPSGTRGSWRGSHPMHGHGTRSLNPIDGRGRHVETMSVPESRRAVTQIGCSSTAQPARPRTSMREHRLCPRGDRCTNP